MAQYHSSNTSNHRDQFTRPTKYWHVLDEDRIQCDLCPRACKLHEGQRGLCYVRGREDNQILLYSYGRSSGFCIDPIEKKPLYHYYPGSPVLSFGTAGCNLACKFCQNWDMSKSRQMDTLSDAASPEALATKAQQMGCKSVAFTYNDPVIFLEYAKDTAIACHEQDVRSVAVTAGYICDAPRQEFFQYMDAVNVDLKSFSKKFYKHLCGGDLDNVLETLLYLKQETRCWLEVTTLLIPGENDSDQELHQMTEWFVEHLGTDVPLHFSAFHPDWKMRDLPQTPISTLRRAQKIALEKRLNYVYLGNVFDPEATSSYCPSCRAMVIERSNYSLGHWALNDAGSCQSCGCKIAGCFDARPGHWGAQRLPVAMR